MITAGIYFNQGEYREVFVEKGGCVFWRTMRPPDPTHKVRYGRRTIATRTDRFMRWMKHAVNAKLLTWQYLGDFR